MTTIQHLAGPRRVHVNGKEQSQNTYVPPIRTESNETTSHSTSAVPKSDGLSLINTGKTSASSRSTTDEVGHTRYQALREPQTSRSSTKAGDGQQYQSKHTISRDLGPAWQPLTLKWPFLCALIMATAILIAVTVTLHMLSNDRSGLADDDGSRLAVFCSRFLPTLVAVVYVFSTSVLLDDIKRTEAYARMATASGTAVENALFWKADAWWSAIFDSLPNRKRGRDFSCTMFCAGVVFVLGFLVISPFSSTLLVTREITFSQGQSFGQLALSTELPISSEALSTTYFRTIGHVLQNVTTSAWITDEYAIVPFWPTAQEEPTMGAVIGVNSEVWQAKTLVASTELECEPMSLKNTSFIPASTVRENGSINNYLEPLMSFGSPSGCVLSLAFDNNTLADIPGFASWAVPTNFSPPYYQSINSSGCVGDEMMIMTNNPFVGDDESSDWNPDFRALGQLCQSKYYVGNASVTVLLSNSESVVSVDDQEYRQSRIPMPQDFLDVAGVQAVFLNTTDWESHLFKDSKLYAGGPALLLGASYEFAVDRLMNNSVLQDARRLKQRYVGELIRDAFDSAVLSDSPRTEVSGQILTTRERIIVVTAVAITLETALSANLVLLLVIFISSRPSRRQLHLQADIATTVAVANVLSRSPNVSQLLRGLKSPLALVERLQGYWCQIRDNELYVFSPDKPNQQRNAKLVNKVKNQSSLPLVLQLLPVFGLVASMVAISVVIAVLLGFSESEGLYQTAFVYQLDINVGNLQLDAINPASIVTTLLAVSVALWWGSVDESMRRLQPFLTLTQGPVRARDGIASSYESSYMLWAALKALRHRHWLLVFICTGSFYAEIFTIAMSALWSRSQSQRAYSSESSLQIELRQVPLLMTGYINAADGSYSTYAGDCLRELFANQTTSWMYGAAIQLTLNGSEPPWSSNGWSFTPVDLSTLPNKTLQDVGDSSSKSDTGEAPLPTSPDITLDTTGIRARIECTAYDRLSNWTSWLTEHNLTNATYWNTTVNPSLWSKGYELGTLECSAGASEIVRGFFCGTAQETYVRSSFFAQPPQLACCENITEEQLGPTSMGYWSSNTGEEVYPLVSDTWPVNFTTKWIRGDAKEGFQMANDSEISHLIWPEPPKMAAMNCMPIIETVNARVTVDTSHNIRDYSLLSEPEPDANAWTDIFKLHYANDTEPSGVEYPMNVTVSHGVLFLSAILGAADLGDLSGPTKQGYADTESLDDQTFNIRTPGLNADYMSYSMLSLVGSNHDALLDPETLRTTAQRVFSTFFQHYASSGVSTTDGGWVFQKLDERLPADLPDVTSASQVEPATSPRASATIPAHITQPVEILQMSTVAAALALAVLAWMVVTAVALACVSRGYRQALLWRIESPADVMMLVAGSGKLLKMVHEKGIRQVKNDPDAVARLGMFRGEDQDLRWGVELAGADLVEHKEDSTSRENESNGSRRSSITANGVRSTAVAYGPGGLPSSMFLTTSSLPRQRSISSIGSTAQSLNESATSPISPILSGMPAPPAQRQLHQQLASVPQKPGESPISPIVDNLLQQPLEEDWRLGQRYVDAIPLKSLKG